MVRKNYVLIPFKFIFLGKTFRESAIRWFPIYDISNIDAVILTHGHADAIFGLDDLRSTKFMSNNPQPINVYQSPECQVVTSRVFDYLYPKRRQGEFALTRFVSNINWITIFPFQIFQATDGFNFLPIPIKHGEDLDCMGYLFGHEHKVCYLSDISRMPENVLQIIQEFGSIDLLIIDTLNPNLPNPVHFNLLQAIELVKIIKPKKTFTIGMNSTIDHDKISQQLKLLKDNENIDIELAYDGLRIILNL